VAAGVIRAGAGRTASGVVNGGGGVFARTAVWEEVAATEVAPTLRTGTAVSESAVPVNSAAISAARAQRAAVAANNMEVAAFFDQVHAQRQVMMQGFLRAGVKPNAQQMGQIMNQAFEQAKAVWTGAGRSLPGGAF